ncbi:MAG: GatB/YqeY domain-containing protein [Clostridiales bacterium]|jgi:uncharacterized protein YqeY|nr:GatB/YqeY domain-containing protein [Clostridiales bacterium]HOC09117.1 GatB/YqeY domain-containing protein [Bacillota bacterium]HQD41795.1 GatB/YqeY domain-containing protein [Bacillota bacterium]
MTLKDRLLSDMRTAMKQKDTVRKTVLSMARAAILQLEKDKRTELDDQGVMEVIAKEIKSRKEALEMFKQGGRQDLVEQNEKEIEILGEYLPPQLSESEIREIIRETIEKVGAAGMKDMGKVMGAVMPQVKGRAEGGTVNRLVKEMLQ